MTIKAALLDEQGIFLRMDELASEADLTDRHLPTITYCDLPPGKYKWIPHGLNSYGGEFDSIERRASIDATERKAAEENMKRGRR